MKFPLKRKCYLYGWVWTEYKWIRLLLLSSYPDHVEQFRHYFPVDRCMHSSPWIVFNGNRFRRVCCAFTLCIPVEHTNTSPIIKYIKWDSIFLPTGSIVIGNDKQSVKHNTRIRLTIGASFQFYGFSIQMQAMFYLFGHQGIIFFVCMFNIVKLKNTLLVGWPMIQNRKFDAQIKSHMIQPKLLPHQFKLNRIFCSCKKRVYT